MDIRLRETEGEDSQPSLLWDTEWSKDLLTESFADWKLAGPTAANNNYGMRAEHALHTAILISLFTWRRAEKYDALPSGTDPKGWWGDTVDLDDNETKIGSKLWLLYRSPLNDEAARRAEEYSHEALAPLIAQGAVSRFDIVATADPVRGWLIIDVKAFSQVGTKVYDQKFERVWRQEFP